MDVETQDWDAESHGGWRAPRLAIAVTFHEVTGCFRAYSEAEAADLVAVLRRADLVVGFAVQSFDYAVLERYGGASLRTVATLDILEEVRARLHRKVGLHQLSVATLGRGKSAEWWQMVRWWRQGQVDRVVEYCRKDVELTWNLYEFGRRNGYVRYWDSRGRLRELHVNWRYRAL
ncbi:MAG: ribonuclease H-like domain-containing protein [Armatimonadota bacterium]|nr:ribonuclease H-like domain-containing protein [Armatimonadota bacterium]